MQLRGEEDSMATASQLFTLENIVGGNGSPEMSMENNLSLRSKVAVLCPRAFSEWSFLTRKCLPAMDGGYSTRGQLPSGVHVGGALQAGNKLLGIWALKERGK